MFSGAACEAAFVGARAAAGCFRPSAASPRGAGRPARSGIPSEGGQRLPGLPRFPWPGARDQFGPHERVLRCDAQRILDVLLGLVDRAAHEMQSGQREFCAEGFRPPGEHVLERLDRLLRPVERGLHRPTSSCASAARSARGSSVTMLGGHASGLPRACPRRAAVARSNSRAAISFGCFSSSARSLFCASSAMPCDASISGQPHAGRRLAIGRAGHFPQDGSRIVEPLGDDVVVGEANADSVVFACWAMALKYGSASLTRFEPM